MYHQPLCVVHIADWEVKVLLAFFLSAWAVVFFAIFAYARGFIPDDQLSIVDKRCFNVTSKRVNSEWVKALRKGVLVFSDQQIVTGIAVLLAAYCIRDTSVYHFQMAIYLAWVRFIMPFGTNTRADTK